MPSFHHELLVELFRACGELAPALLSACAGIDHAHDRAELGSSDLSQVTSTEYRADAVVLLRDPANAVIAAHIVEVQRTIDPRKRESWPVYLAALRARYRCPVVLLVLAPDPLVAAWARTPIDIGHPGFSLVPVVIELASIPRIVDRDLARKLPELAVLSALAHPDLEVARTAIAAILSLADERTKVYLDVVIAAVAPDTRRTLEEEMQGYVYQSEFAIRYFSQGREQGLQEGREHGLQEGREHGLQEGREHGIEEGRERGIQEGRAIGLRAAVLALVRAKLGSVTTADEAAIEAVHTERDAAELIHALSQATDAAAVRAVLTAARADR